MPLPHPKAPSGRAPETDVATAPPSTRLCCGGRYKRQHIRRRTAIPFWYEPICRGADPLLLDSPCQASLLALDRRCPRCDIASFYVWTDDVHFGHRVLVSPSFGDFTSPIPAPLLVRNVIHDSHRCPSRLDVEYPPGLFSIFCRREENLKRQAETGNMTCTNMAVQGKSLSPDRYAQRATPPTAVTVSSPTRRRGPRISSQHRHPTLGSALNSSISQVVELTNQKTPCVKGTGSVHSGSIHSALFPRGNYI